MTAQALLDLVARLVSQTVEALAQVNATAAQAAGMCLTIAPGVAALEAQIADLQHRVAALEGAQVKGS